LILDVYFPNFEQFFQDEKNLYALTRLCSKGKIKDDTNRLLEACLFQKFGVSKQKDWPLAAISAFSSGLDVKEGYWFLIHAVHFGLERDNFRLNELIVLEKDEKKLLIDCLNKHFFDDRFRFFKGNEDVFCYLNVMDEVDVETHLVSEVIGNHVSSYAPRGSQGLKWQSFINEIQMLLHDHPLNIARENSGLLPVNSIWLSAGGCFKKPNQNFCNDFTVITNNRLIRELSIWAGKDCRPLINTKSHLDQTINSKEFVWVMDDGRNLDAIWFMYWLEGLKSKKIQTLNCHFDIEGTSHILTIKPVDLWKFWKTSLPAVFISQI
jgi:hypothetical protein